MSHSFSSSICSKLDCYFWLEARNLEKIVRPQVRPWSATCGPSSSSWPRWRLRSNSSTTTTRNWLQFCNKYIIGKRHFLGSISLIYFHQKILLIFGWKTLFENHQKQKLVWIFTLKIFFSYILNFVPSKHCKNCVFCDWYQKLVFGAKIQIPY